MNLSQRAILKLRQNILIIEATLDDLHQEKHRPAINYLHKQIDLILLHPEIAVPNELERLVHCLNPDTSLDSTITYLEDKITHLSNKIDEY